MMTRLARNFPAAREWTVEAGRPDTATPDMLAMLRQAGVDRISVNPQTLQQHLLDALGRRHRVEDIYTMYEDCRKLGFSVINMDFIAGLPGQTVADMQENMEIVCKLHPENVTIHTLALKKRAPLFHHELRAAIPPAEETGHMVRLCQSILTAGGYVPYYMYRQKYMAASFANIGYALPGSVSAYNIEMMEERQSVLAAGPGGATKFLCRDGHTLEKVYMPKDVDAYVQALAEKYPDLHIIHFDAHADLRDDYLGAKLSHACVLRRCWEVLGDGRITQFGIRSGDREEWRWGKEHVTTHPFIVDMEVLQETLRKLEGKPVYFTLDLDVLDPSVFPGTGTPEPGGISFEELRRAVTQICSAAWIVGCDVNELSPALDASGASTAVACKIVREMLLALLGNPKIK